MPKSNFNYIDYLTSGQDYVSDSFDSEDSPQEPTLRFGVVVEVLNDPASIPAKSVQKLYTECVNKEYFLSAPRNSIIVRDITNAYDKALAAEEQKTSVAYPLFPPHFALPLKAGETVFLVDPDPANDSDLLYWLCRIPSPDYVDDINFTHWDRVLIESAIDKDDRDEYPSGPEFTNGLGTPDTYTLGRPEDYDMIFTGSHSNKSVNFESVPRFTKRPGDLVLQGSNNALICLGEDRGFGAVLGAEPNKTSTDPAAEDSTRTGVEAQGVSNANMLATDSTNPCGNQTDAVDGAKEPSRRGTIDIVAGRGQVEGTRPFVIANSRGWEETNKNPVKYGSDFTESGADPPLEEGEEPDERVSVKNNWYANPQEGDPDFTNDLSRVYVSMKTDGDANFQLMDSLGDVVTEASAGNAIDVLDSSYVVLKSNEVRIVARKDDALDPPVDGSIRLIKEGPDASNRCSISLLPEGKVVIDANEIMIGAGPGQTDPTELGDVTTISIGKLDTTKIYLAAKGGDAGSPIGAANGPNSVIIGEKLYDALNTFCTDLLPAVGNLGGPVTACVTAATNLQTFLTKAGPENGLSTLVKISDK